MDNHKSLTWVDLVAQLGLIRAGKSRSTTPGIDQRSITTVRHCSSTRADETGLRVPHVRATIELGTFALMTLLYTLCSVRRIVAFLRCGLSARFSRCEAGRQLTH